MEWMNKDIIEGIKEIGVGEGELVEAAEGEMELGVEVERGGREAAVGNWELGGEEELEGKLGLAAAAFGYDFGDGIARDSAVKEIVEDWAAGGEFRGVGWKRVVEEGFGIHRRCI